MYLNQFKKQNYLHNFINNRKIIDNQNNLKFKTIKILDKQNIKNQIGHLDKLTGLNNNKIYYFYEKVIKTLNYYISY